MLVHDRMLSRCGSDLVRLRYTNIKLDLKLIRQNIQNDISNFVSIFYQYEYQKTHENHILFCNVRLCM